MGAGAVLSALGGAAAGLWDRAYSYWRDQVADNRADRDFDYQKALQNQIFQREDNAVQRRMEDLQKAGLNPNLAAGSAAGAGAVVGRSNTPTSNFHTGSGNPVGTALDMATHVTQLRNAREQNEILRNQNRESKANADMAQNANTLDTLNLIYQLGLKPYLSWSKGKDGKINFHPGFVQGDDFYERFYDSPLVKQLEWQFQNNKNSAFMLQKDADFYTADKIAEYIGAGARAVGNLTGGVGSIGSAYYNFNRRR